MKIQLPSSKSSDDSQTEFDIQTLVIIGANGSGKTRFSAKIEELNSKKTHRISAQKSLRMNPDIAPKSKNRAEKELHYGLYHENWSEAQFLANKRSARWGNNPNTHLLNDFDQLLTFLQTDQYEVSLDYQEGRTEKQVTKLDIVQKIWEQVLPHRKLYKRAGCIESYPSDNEDNKYNAAEMSDGERVIFYLIGQVICCQANSLIIIDEPEMHIHRSLVKKLFDLIENERKDCSLIYLTHDIDFAVSRNNAEKIWMKSYEGSDIWDYCFLPQSSSLPNIPEEIYLEILGSRKPVLFIEPDPKSNNTIDDKLYRRIFPDHTIKKLGGSGNVINIVSSFNKESAFHNIKAVGIVDRDRRNDNDVKTLNSKSIWVLDVAEVENLFLLEEVVKAVAHHENLDENKVFEIVRNKVFDFFESKMGEQISLHFRERMSKELSNISKFDYTQSREEIILSIQSRLENIQNDKESIYEGLKQDLEAACEEKNYDKILKILNHKGVLNEIKIFRILDLINLKKYINKVISLLESEDEISQRLVNAIHSKIVKDSHLST